MVTAKKMMNDSIKFLLIPVLPPSLNHVLHLFADYKWGEFQKLPKQLLDFLSGFRSSKTQWDFYNLSLVP